MGEAHCIGIVTVTYNSGSVLDGFMASLLAQAYSDWRLYVIDNASSDDTLEILSRHIDGRIHQIQNQENLGVATGNNQGINAALADGCEAVLLMNNDTEFGPDLLGDLIATKARTSADMIVPKMMFFDPKNHIWCAGGRFNRLRGYTSIHCGEGEPDRGQWDHSGEIEYCPTCCMLVTPETFQRIGLMDDAYFVYWDDSDFCFRAKKAGLRLYYDHTIRLCHKVSSLTGGSGSAFSRRYYTRNKVYFLLKNLGWLGLFHVILFEIFLLVRPDKTRDGWKQRQKAFWEGVRLYRSIFGASESL